MLRVIREARFAALIAGAIMAGTLGTAVGSATAGPAVLLSDITAGVGGFAIDGAAPGDYSGYSVCSAGDVNGDGLADLIVGANLADTVGTNLGRAYIVFGKAAGSRVQLSDVAAGRGGFAINGNGGNFASSVSGAGDVNGDGLADLIIGAPEALILPEFDRGRAYVVFGKADTSVIQITDVTAGVGGFEIIGDDGRFGNSVSAAGDINGDGLADMIIGAYRRGFSYVIYGKTDGRTVEISNIFDGRRGFRITSQLSDSDLGTSVSGAGDVNGDGIDDLVVGAVAADVNGSGSGRTYVVFGRNDRPGTIFLTPSNGGFSGFVIEGEKQRDYSGFSISGTGDVNGDGLADLIIGAFGADPNGSRSGRSYVVFGKATRTPVQLSDISAGAGGFRIDGESLGDYSGYSVSGAGDINGDGLADLIIGAQFADTRRVNAGRSYLVLGSRYDAGPALGRCGRGRRILDGWGKA